MGSRRSRVEVAVAAAAAAALFLPLTAPWQALDDRWLDTATRWRAERQSPDPSIVIVAVDEYSTRSMAGIAGSWPWPRSVHADLIHALRDAGARAIVFDILFAEPDRFRPEHDAYLADALEAASDVYLPILVLDGDDMLAPRAAELPSSVAIVAGPDADPDARVDVLLPALGDPEHWRVGAINVTPDADGRIRRYPLYVERRGWRVPSLPARIAADAGAALPAGDALRIDWRGAYPAVAYADAYGHLLRGEPLPAATFADRIVVVGMTASGLHDLHATPLGAHTPGVRVLANALDNLLNGDMLQRPPAAASVGALAVIFVLAAVAWRRRWALMPLLAGLGLASVMAFGGSAFAATRAYLIPVASLVAMAWLLFLGAAVFHYLLERRARRHALDLFGRFLDPTVVRELAERGIADESTRARDCEITVLFSDIRGFTTLSESRPAHEIMALLNEYFARQVEVIFKHGGTLDKFIGDAIMAFWGAPVGAPDHARRAVAAALEMAERADEFRDELGIDGFGIGIGLNTGPAVVGMLGSALRYDYTAIGDTVNLASRIEGLTKDRARILVSASTRAACGDAFTFTPAGSSEVKGRTGRVELYVPGR